VFIFVSFTSCSKKDNDSAKNNRSSSSENTKLTDNTGFPEGYPAELILPEGISVNDIETGTGRKPTPGQVNDEIFNVYVIYKKHPDNYKKIISHYKKLFAKENHWQGNWESNNPNQLYGSFKKNNMHVAVEISRDYFSLKIEVYDKLITETVLNFHLTKQIKEFNNDKNYRG
jgi:hypothetical protein